MLCDPLGPRQLCCGETLTWRTIKKVDKRRLCGHGTLDFHRHTAADCASDSDLELPGNILQERDHVRVGVREVLRAGREISSFKL